MIIYPAVVKIYFKESKEISKGFLEIISKSVVVTLDDLNMHILKWC